jgi:hypothetical protein
MPDEDFAKIAPPVEEEIEELEADTEETEEAEEDVETDNGEDEKEEEIEEETEAEEDVETDNEGDAKEEEIEEGDAETDDKEAENNDEDETQEDDKSEEDKEEALDYKALYEELMSPFKANGREFKPKSIEDLKNLARMGIDYSKNMHSLKPARKILKLLQNNELLDEEKLNHLIDISKGDSGAITKLIKDSEIDPMEIDLEEAEAYKPNNYTVTDAEVELEPLLDKIRQSAHGEKTLAVFAEEWDDASAALAAQNPRIVSVIHDHVETGVYDKIMDEVLYQRTLGNLDGVPDFDAYKLIGNQLEANGKFEAKSQSNNQQRKKVMIHLPILN